MFPTVSVNTSARRSAGPLRPGKTRPSSRRAASNVASTPWDVISPDPLALTALLNTSIWRNRVPVVSRSTRVTTSASPTKSASACPMPIFRSFVTTSAVMSKMPSKGCIVAVASIMPPPARSSIPERVANRLKSSAEMLSSARVPNRSSGPSI